MNIFQKQTNKILHGSLASKTHGHHKCCFLSWDGLPGLHLSPSAPACLWVSVPLVLSSFPGLSALLCTYFWSFWFKLTFVPSVQRFCFLFCWTVQFLLDDFWQSEGMFWHWTLLERVLDLVRWIEGICLNQGKLSAGFKLGILGAISVILSGAFILFKMGPIVNLATPEFFAMSMIVYFEFWASFKCTDISLTLILNLVAVHWNSPNFSGPCTKCKFNIWNQLQLLSASFVTK